MRFIVRRPLALLVAAPLAFIAIAAATPAANAGGNGAGEYRGDSATFSITIGGYGDHGVRQGRQGRRGADARRYQQPRHGFDRHRHGRGYGHGNGRGYGRGYDRERPRAHGGGRRSHRYAGRGVGYGCYIAYRHGRPLTVCRDGYGTPFIVGNRY